jgi:hypothetical protein
MIRRLLLYALFLKLLSSDKAPKETDRFAHLSLNVVIAKFRFFGWNPFNAEWTRRRDILIDFPSVVT